MTVYRSIRVQITDRPGALFAITAALAAHGVDIVRLDVISSDGTIVVDDLFLGAPSAAAIGDACASFPGDATVRTWVMAAPVSRFLASRICSSRDSRCSSNCL